MHPIKAKKELEQKLIRRGMLIQMNGNVLEAPKRMFKTLGEEILWILNEAELKLTVNQLAAYLNSDQKTIQKVMRKLTMSNVNLVKKQKLNSNFVYSANFRKALNIPTLYKLVRMEATKKIR